MHVDIYTYLQVYVHMYTLNVADLEQENSQAPGQGFSSSGDSDLVDV